MEIDQYVSEELTKIIDVKDDQVEFFKEIFQQLKEKGYVEDSFLEAVENREKEYPTGLKTRFFGVAIPHTEPVHVKRPFILIVKLKQPVSFGQMGSMNEQIKADYAFVLGFKKGDDQLEILQHLMVMFSDSETMQQLAVKDTEKDIFHVVKQYYLNREREFLKW